MSRSRWSAISVGVSSLFVLALFGCSSGDGTASDANTGGSDSNLEASPLVDGGADALPGDAGSADQVNQTDAAGDGGGGTGCYPPCLTAVRDRCPLGPTESCTYQEGMACFGSGIRENTYTETIGGGTYRTTLRTMQDGQTPCFYSSQQTGGTGGPVFLIRDETLTVVLTAEFIAGTRFSGTCVEEGRTYEFDTQSPSCPPRPVCQMGTCP